MSVSSVQTAFKAFRRHLPSRPRIYVGGGPGAPLALAEALSADPDLAAGVTFVGPWIPGLDQTDWASLHADAYGETSFVGPVWHRSLEQGKTRVLPLTYSQTWTWLCHTPLDGAILVTSPTDPLGRLSFGVAPDFGPALTRRADLPILALTTPHMPAPAQSPTFKADRAWQIVDTTTNLAGRSRSDPNDNMRDLGQQVARLIGDGDTLQIGIGRVPGAILASLHQHRGLRFHSGLITDDVLALMEAGAVARHAGSIATGIAWGSPELYRRCAEDPCFSFHPVCHTHEATVLAAIPRFKAINSAIGVDLWGQANAETVNGRPVSGIGGLSDFLRGARSSPGGRGILALPATARQGTVSRITAELPAGDITLSRYDVDMVVTEYGVADLGGRTAEERAQALIAIAAPAFRDELAARWEQILSRRGGV